MSVSNKTAPQVSWPAAGLTALSVLMQRIANNLQRWIATAIRAPQTQPPRWGAGAATAIALTVVAVIASMFFVDAAAIQWALHLPHWLVGEAYEITNFGLSGYFLYPLGVLLLGIAAIKAPSLPRAAQGTLAALAARFGFLFIAIALPGLFAAIVKRLIGRARPYVGDHDPFAYVPFIWRPDHASLPSGHATTAAAVAIAVGAMWPRLRAIAWVYALAIMLTRVVIDVHHPSDVIAGGLVGVVGALLVRRWFAARRLVFRAHDLRAYGWPSFKRIKAAAQSIAIGFRGPSPS
jgi:membrane-associated phospholipid phosphatase